MSKLILSGFIGSLLIVSLISYSFPAFAENPELKGKPEVVGISGIVPGKDLIVHVLVVVNPGEDKHQVALAALAQQGARPFMPNEFSTTGLKWDQFLDGNSGNDYVDQFYNPQGDPTTGQNGQTALTNSQTTWSSVDSSNFSFNFAGTTNRCPSLVQECKGPQKFDGKNDVAWMRLTSPTTLGVTWSGTSTDEADMALNTAFNWKTGYDAETVFLHENGHALGLGHSQTTDSVMYAYYQNVDHDLHADDIVGITSLYPKNSGTVDVTLQSVTISPSSCTIQIGDSCSFDATAHYSDDSTSDVTLLANWSIVNSTVATVSSGFAQGENPGSTTISASYDGKEGTTTITVNSPSETLDSVDATVSYSTYGGKNSDKHLNIGVQLNPSLSGATVEISISLDGQPLISTSVLTDANGFVGFSLTNASPGDYLTTVVSVSGVNTVNTINPSFTK